MVDVTCTRCGASGQGADPIHAKFGLVHERGCGPKIGIVSYGVYHKAEGKSVENVVLDETPAEEVTEKPKKKFRKKKSSD